MEIDKLKKFKLAKFIIIGTFLLELVVPLIYLYIRQIEKCFNSSYLVSVSNLMNSPKILVNNPIIFIILISILFIIFMAKYNLKISLKNSTIETKGIIFKEKDGTHGTAGFANIKDLKHILTVGNEEKTNGIILGKTIDTDEIIILPDSYKKLNRNIMVFGASGSGKSRKFIVPNILKIAEQDERARNLENAIQQGKNIIVTDPKRRTIL